MPPRAAGRATFPRAPPEAGLAPARRLAPRAPGSRPGPRALPGGQPGPRAPSGGRPGHARRRDAACGLPKERREGEREDERTWQENEDEDRDKMWREWWWIFKEGGGGREI